MFTKSQLEYRRSYWDLSPSGNCWPTATFRVLFVFVMSAHERRRIVRFNITKHPTAHWPAQHIVAAFPWEPAPRYLLRARDPQEESRVVMQHVVPTGPVRLQTEQVGQKNPYS
jgi:hypothetical protein